MLELHPASQSKRESSCLALKLSCYVDLTVEDRELLALLEDNALSCPADATLQEEGDSFQSLYIVQDGWLFSSSLMQNGNRHIAHLFLPGDIIGLCDLAFLEVTCTITACTRCELFKFPKIALDDVMIYAPRLSALLLSLSARDQIILLDTLRANSRMDARERILHMLMMLYYRLRVVNQDLSKTLGCPLTQTQMGDYLGLTNVTVSKVLSQLERDGWITRENDTIGILRLDDIRRSIDVHDRYSKLDSSWFPAPGRVAA